MLRRLAIVALVLLPACGDDNPVAPSPPPPTPPPVSFSGTYSGPMCVTGGGVACLSVTGRTTTTQSGTSLSFDSLTISGAASGTFGGAQAVMNGTNFNGVGSYTASCGLVNTLYTGFFSPDGRLMNLRVTLSGCADVQFLGEISR